MVISYSVIQIQEKSHVCLSVANFSGPLKVIQDRITRQFQTTLTNVISHEQNTPLNAIINGCESLYYKLKPKSISHSQGSLDIRARQSLEFKGPMENPFGVCNPQFKTPST